MSSNVTDAAGACADEVQDFCMKIVSNPDISGIGVRTAMYVQTVLNMVIPSLFPNNLQIIRNTARATYVLSISLICASIGQWRTGGISLLDAIVGTMLATMMTAFATVNRQYIATLGFSLNFTTALFFIFWTYWGFQIWIDPWNFGLQPSPDAPDAGISACTANLDTQFVIVGKSIAATNNGLRIFALIVFGITIIPTIGSIWSVILWTLKVIASGGELEARINEAYRTAKRDRHRIGAGAGKTKLNSMGGFVGLIYMMVTIEQMIARNDATSQLSDWSLGQSLAVIMLLQQIFDICSWLKEMVQHKREMAERDRRSSTSSASSGDTKPPGQAQEQV